MDAYVTAIRQGEFQNEQGQKVQFAKIQVMNDAHEDNERVKGRRCDDYPCSFDLIKTIEAKSLPGWFEANVSLHNGKATITALKAKPASNASSVKTI